MVNPVNDGMTSATNQLKELLQLSSFAAMTTNAGSGTVGAIGGAVCPQVNSLLNSFVNDLNADKVNNGNQLVTSHAVRHPLPNNCTIKVNTSSIKNLFDVLALKVAEEGHESTNSDFTKIERLVDFNWDYSANVNWIAVSNRKPFIAYVIHKVNRQTNMKTKQSNVAINDSANTQMIRIMNYESRQRLLVKGVFHHPIADLSFAINSVSSNSLDVSKLAVADKGGNLYIYSIKEDNSELTANQVLEIVNDGNTHDFVRLSWCPYIPSEDEDVEVEGDPGLTLALTCDDRLELFAIDLLQTLYKETIVVEMSKLRASNTGYQLIERAHEGPITSTSIAQEVTAICTTGLDNKIRFYSVTLNQKSSSAQKGFLKEWNICKEYKYYERDDQMSAFFFLDDFDYLLCQQDPIFWGYGLIGTRCGHIAIINLKDWHLMQTLKLTAEYDIESTVFEEFTYKMDLTAHYVLAIRGHDAFLLHIHFPYDKEENYEDYDIINNTNREPFDNSFPYISKVTRFQIYNTPLRSFAVKKSILGNLLIFWINNKSLEMCCIDPTLIVAEETCPVIMQVEASALNNSSTVFNKNLDLIGDVPMLNGYNAFDALPAEPIADQIGSNVLETQIMVVTSSIAIPVTPNVITDTIPSLNLLPIPPQPTFSTQSFPTALMARPESPTSKEVEHILNPTLTMNNALNATISNTDALKSLLHMNANLDPFHVNQNNDQMMARYQPTLDPYTIQPVIPKDFLNGLAREEQLKKVKADVFKEIQDSENRIVQVIERLDYKMSAKLNASNDQILNNSKVQTSKIETDIREMKKELKTACKIRNEEFNKIVEKLVNKVMHEMNVIVQKGFHELMDHVNKELKNTTKEFDKNIQTMQTKVIQSMEKVSANQFRSLAAPVGATPVMMTGTPTLSNTPALPSNQTPLVPMTPASGMRTTPQQLFNSATHSVPSTPLPYSTPKNTVNTSINRQTPAADPVYEQQKAAQKKRLYNEIILKIGAGNYEEALTKALNLENPDLVVNICESFRDRPSVLINTIKKDQTVLVSLLQQLIIKNGPIYKDNMNWKIGFIEQILPNLDLEETFVMKYMSSLIPKITQMLDLVMSSASGPVVDKARILSFTFNNLLL